jgi:hypothetical protein
MNAAKTNAMTTKNEIDCTACKELLPDLLLDPGAAATHQDAAGHLKSCAECRSEYDGLRATFALMDEWTAPEPSTYFDTRLQARLREEMDAQPEGLWERLRSFVLYSTGRQFRPIVAGAMGCVLLLGGAGTLAGVYQPWNHAAASSATVNDLKILDNNAQAEQQLNQLLDDSGSNDDGGAQTPTT